MSDLGNIERKTYQISVCVECGCHNAVPGTGFCAECSGDEWTFVEVAPATDLRGAVSVADVEQLLRDTSRYFSGDHVNAGVVVGEMRKRLRALAGAQS